MAPRNETTQSPWSYQSRLAQSVGMSMRRNMQGWDNVTLSPLSQSKVWVGTVPRSHESPNLCWNPRRETILLLIYVPLQVLVPPKKGTTLKLGLSVPFRVRVMNLKHGGLETTPKHGGEKRYQAKAFSNKH